jgi:DNA-binding GntR family transcriptional regulator
MDLATALTETPGPDQTVYQSIQTAILSHRLPPGTKLTEEKLSTIFGVSRERIRKVILRLAHDKCVDLKPNRGAYVARPGVEEARDVFEARRVIEAHLVDLVSRNATEADFVRLEANLAAERDDHRQGLFRQAVSTSGDFHLLLAGTSGNLVLGDILKDLVARSSLILAMYGEKRFDLCALDDHTEILRKLREGNASRAKKLMVEHLQEIEDNLRFDQSRDKLVDLTAIFAGV